MKQVIWNRFFFFFLLKYWFWLVYLQLFPHFPQNMMYNFIWCENAIDIFPSLNWIFFVRSRLWSIEWFLKSYIYANFHSFQHFCFYCDVQLRYWICVNQAAVIAALFILFIIYLFCVKRFQASLSILVFKLFVCIFLFDNSFDYTLSWALSAHAFIYFAPLSTSLYLLFFIHTSQQ